VRRGCCEKGVYRDEDRRELLRQGDELISWPKMRVCFVINLNKDHFLSHTCDTSQLFTIGKRAKNGCTMAGRNSSHLT